MLMAAFLFSATVNSDESQANKSSSYVLYQEVISS